MWTTNGGGRSVETEGTVLVRRRVHAILVNDEPYLLPFRSPIQFVWVDVGLDGFGSHPSVSLLTSG